MWNNGANCFGGGFPMMMGGGLMMILFWGLFIWFIFYAIRKGSLNDKTYHAENAVNLLKQRYSRGEINTVEYRERLKELTDTMKKN